MDNIFDDKQTFADFQTNYSKYVLVLKIVYT